jgi:hypothetical protein
MAETTVLRSSSINRTPNGGAKPQTQLSGALPVVQVNMNAGGPQIQGGRGTARQGVTILPPKGGTRNFTTGGLPNQPAKPSVVVMSREQRVAVAAGAEAPLTADQLLLCRHLVDKYLDEQRAAIGEEQIEGAVIDNVKLGEATIGSIDAAMAAMTAAAAAAAATAAAAAAAPPPRRAVAVGGPRHVAAGAAPRRVARPAPPPVIVTMDAGRPIPTPPDVADEGPIESDAPLAG